MKQHVRRQHGNVSRHGAHAEEVQQEVSRVLSTNAVVHPHAMVIKTLDTPIADPAVFGASRFEELASWTGGSRVE